MYILLTGGAKGLGSAIVRRLAQNTNDQIFFTYASSLTAAQKITTEFPNTTAIHCDFAKVSSINDLVSKLSTLNINVLINNAYSSFQKEHFYKADPERYLKSFELNVLPVIKITQGAIKEFRKVKSGKIINVISSSVLNTPTIGWSDYVANKNYLLSLSKSWATENIRFNITSNCISPGFMRTDFTSDTDERIIEQMIQAHPLKRLLTVEEVAEAISFLAKCTYHINGINLVLNAGETIL